MPIATTYFIKAQVPKIDLASLLALYKREILIQGAGEAAINGNMVEFSGSAWHFGFNRYNRKFAGFSGGQLIIEETTSTFEVYLEASSPKWIFLFDVYFTQLRNNLEREIQEVV